jgi:hypothetical protein
MKRADKSFNGFGVPALRPYWITFADLEDFSSLGRGVGVTANDVGDALTLIESALGPLTIAEITVVEDVATLDEGHVRPNMGSIFLRGIWYPLGHEQVGTPRVR